MRKSLLTDISHESHEFLFNSFYEDLLKLELPNPYKLVGVKGFDISEKVMSLQFF